MTPAFLRSPAISHLLRRSLSPSHRPFLPHPPPSGPKRSTLPTSASLVPPTDTYALLAALSLCAASAQSLTTRSRLARALSAPVLAMLLAAVLTNLSILPSPPPRTLPLLQSAATRLATPLLLLSADLRVVFRDTASLTIAFLFAALSTFIGALVAYAAISFLHPNLGEAYQLAAAIAAKNIGGGINFMAVLDTYGADASARFIGIGLAADNILGLLYFPINAYLLSRLVPHTTATVPPPPKNPQNTSVPTLTRAVAFSLSITALAQRLVPSAPVPAAAALSVALATALPSLCAPLAPAGTALGTLGLYGLFAAAGVSGASVRSLLSPANRGHALLFVAFCAVLYAVHVVLVLAAVWFSRQRGRPDDAKLLLIASNASIGGPATAAALAEAKGYHDIVAPATVVGTFGNAVGSFVGLAVGKIIQIYFAP